VRIVISRRDGSRALLVEGFVPAANGRELSGLVGRLEDEAGGPAAPAGVRHIHSILVPGDEMCLCLVEGPSAEAVRVVAERAGIRVYRVTEAVVVFGGVRR